MEIKRDCILYKNDKVCSGLVELLCSKKECSFYKNEKEYNKDGSRKNNNVFVKEKA